MKSEKVLKFFVVLLIAVFFVHQAAAAVYKPISTESATYYTAADGLNITGLIIRNETLVNRKAAELCTLLLPTAAALQRMAL